GYIMRKLIIGIMSISLIVFGYYYYIAQMDKKNNEIELNVEQSLEHKLTTKDYESFTYKITNNTNKNFNLLFGTGNEIDVEFHTLTDSPIKEGNIITVEAQPTEKHYKEFNKGDTLEYIIRINPKLLSKGDYQLTAQFIPSNAMTLNKVEQIITHP
ncbi:hypothetical protein ACFWDG_21145, partial [Peribacillus sp. NPDC060186]